VDEDKPPGRGERINLVAMPVSKDTTFDFKGEYTACTACIAQVSAT
jgi:hypothetical protein